MKTVQRKFLIAIAAMLLVTQAQAVLFWARPYDPNLGRWIQRDPIGERGGINLYGYCKNDPNDRVDTDGLSDISLPYDRNDLTRSQYDQLTSQCGIPQSNNRSSLLNYGCIGICMAAQGQDAKKATSPEQYGDTQCFATEAEARQRDCGKCKHKVVFSKQGTYSGGNAPTPGQTGVFPTIQSVQILMGHSITSRLAN